MTMKLKPIKQKIKNKIKKIISVLLKALRGGYVYFWKLYINLKNNGIFDIFTHLTNMEKITLYKTAAKTEKAVVVEIGSYLGASSCFLAAGLKGGVIYCIDTWKNDTMSNDQEDTYPAFKENTKKYIDKIIPIRGWSHEVIDEFSEKIDKNKIDLLFIDGDHSYNGVKKDWDLYSPLLGKNAVVIFHDYGWAEGVKEVIHNDVIKRCKNFKSLPNMWWGWIK